MTARPKSLDHFISTHPRVLSPLQWCVDTIQTYITNNTSFHLKHPGVPDSSDGSNGTSYRLTEIYTLPVAYVPPLLWAWYTHHENYTCVTLIAGAAVML